MIPFCLAYWSRDGSLKGHDGAKGNWGLGIKTAAWLALSLWRVTFHAADLALVSKELVAQDTNQHTFIDGLHVPER